VTSKLISIETKKKLHMTMIRAIVTYGYEICTLSALDVNTILVFGRQILKRKYGRVKPEEGWGIKNNDKLVKLMRGEDIVKYIRIKRIKW
jgi:hypothetical protein